jgi:predicted ester cyclase
MMVTRRDFLSRTLAAGAGLALPLGPAMAQPAGAAAERNKSVVQAYKRAMAKRSTAALAEFMAPGYKRLRAGVQNIARNAEGQGFPSPGAAFWQDAFPDREDHVEEIIAEGDMVAMLWRITGTHRGNFYGIPATGKPVDFLEIGYFRMSGGKIAEGWFMADEAGLLRQLGQPLPKRKDGKLIAPPVTDAGEEGDAVLKRLTAAPAAGEAARNKIIVARSKSTQPPQPGDRAATFKQKRFGLQHLHDYGDAHKVADQTPTSAFPGRNDHVVSLLAEGDRVWMRFFLRGKHEKGFYGLPPTGNRVEMPEVGIMRFAGGKWAEAFYFGDELGLVLQLGAPDMLLG